MLCSQIQNKNSHWLVPGADWAVWHLPGGPVGPASRWAATSNVEVGQMTYPINRGRVGREGREGSEEQSYKEEESEGRNGTEQEVQGLLASEGRALFGYLCMDPPSF